MVSEIKQIYRDSTKPDDILWNTWVARPLAAVVVYLLRRTPVTPNQVTFLGGALFIGVAVSLVMMRDPAGLLWAAAILEFSYVLDCADGQLARLTGKTSDVGAYLDFLIDEFKALILVGGFSVRLWMLEDDVTWLLVGIGGLAIVSMATSLTNFTRRKQYAGEEIKPGESARRGEVPEGVGAKMLWALQKTASFVIHYPSWFVFLALANLWAGFDGNRWFMYLFVGVYVLYTAKTGAAVVWKLGRSSFYEK